METEKITSDTNKEKETKPPESRNNISSIPSERTHEPHESDPSK
jgi:hypothetical protein